MLGVWDKTLGVRFPIKIKEQKGKGKVNLNMLETIPSSSRMEAKNEIIKPLKVVTQAQKQKQEIAFE